MRHYLGRLELVSIATALLVFVLFFISIVMTTQTCSVSVSFFHLCSHNKFPSPPAVDTTTAFPAMSDVKNHGTVLGDPQQPTIDATGMWIWPGPDGYKKKPVVGNFATNLVVVESVPTKTTVSTNGSEVTESSAVSNDSTAMVATVISMLWIALSL